jgi:hypothetical protein
MNTLEEEKEMSTKIEKCPHCGGTKRLIADLVTKAKADKVVGENFNMFYDLRRGTILDKDRTGIIAIGSKIPSYVIGTDVCTDCGCVYVVEYAIGEAVVSLKEGGSPPSKLIRG